MVKIDERIDCPACKKDKAVLSTAIRSPDEDGPVDPEGGPNDFMQEMLHLMYFCRSCKKITIVTIHGL